jgi:hypothetical protein
MIIDAILVLPSIIIAGIWQKMAVAVAFPAVIYTSAITAGTMLARLNFIFPIATLGDMLFWYMTMLIAYFFVWLIFVVLFIYNALKLF